MRYTGFEVREDHDVSRVKCTVEIGKEVTESNNAGKWLSYWVH